MLRRFFEPPRWLLLATIFLFVHRSVASSFENKTGPSDSRTRVFSPRMDYDEWTPLGRGDPLKNDPTFDYVPPVLDRVQYWLDSHTTEPSAKRDILILGVTAKKTSPKLPEHFLKFVDGPKFNRIKDPIFKNDYTGSTGAEPPKLMRTNSFRNGPMDFRSQNKIQSFPASYYPSPFYNQKSKPYTVMMPPPLNQKPINEGHNSFGNMLKDKIIFPEQFSTQTEEGPTLQDYNHHPKPFSQGHPPLRSTFSHMSPAPLKSKQPMIIPQLDNMQGTLTSSSFIPNVRFEATTPSVSFEQSNLVYQSTQTLSDGWIGSSRPTSSISPIDANQITWKTPDRYQIDHHGSASTNHEVVIGQNANIIVDGDHTDNEEVVIGQKDTSPKGNSFQVHSQVNHDQKTHLKESSDGSQSIKHLTDDEFSIGSSKTHIVVANSPSSLDLDNQKEAVSVVMPNNYNEKKQNSAESTTLSQHLTSTNQHGFSKVLNSNFINQNSNFVGKNSESQGVNTVGQGESPLVQGTYSVGHSANFINQNTNSKGHGANSLGQTTNSVGHSTNSIDHSTNSFSQTTNSAGHYANSLGQITNSIGHKASPLGQNTNLGQNANIMSPMSDFTVQNSNSVGQYPNSMDQPSNFMERKTNPMDQNTNTMGQHSNFMGQYTNSMEQDTNLMGEYTNRMVQNINPMNQNINSLAQKPNTLGQGTESISKKTIDIGQSTHSINQNINGNTMLFTEFSNSESINPNFMSSQSSMEIPAQMSKPQPFRNNMMPHFMEESQTVFPLNGMSSKRLTPTRHPQMKHPSFNTLGEGLQHPRPVMMHRPGEPRPGFRPPMSLGHMPSSHMHMSPPKSVMGPPMTPNQAYQRPQEHMKHQDHPEQIKYPNYPEHMKHQDNLEQVKHQDHPQFFPSTFTSSPFASGTTPALQITQTRDQILTTMQPFFTPTTLRPLPSVEWNQSPLMQLLNNEEIQKAEMGSSTSNDQTASSLQTTTVPNLTTDPIFSHYKQPAKPIRGPMYLIIQGHSKVKTYKPTVNKYGFPVNNNEIFDSTTRAQSRFEKLVNENAKASAAIREKDINARKKMEERIDTRGGPKNLLSFIEHGLSAFTVSPPPAMEKERQHNSVTTIEINGN